MDRIHEETLVGSRAAARATSALPFLARQHQCCDERTRAGDRGKTLAGLGPELSDKREPVSARRKCPALCREKPAPLGKSGGAVLLDV